MDDKLSEIFKTMIEVERIKLNQIDRLFDCLQEMTEITDDFLLWLVEYCKTHDIPVWKKDTFVGYIQMSQKILRDIRETDENLKELIESRKLPLKWFIKRSPDESPEPVKLILSSFNGHYSSLVRQFQK